MPKLSGHDAAVRAPRRPRAVAQHAGAIAWFVERASFEHDRLTLTHTLFVNDAPTLEAALRNSSLSILSAARPRDPSLDLQLTGQAIEAIHNALRQAGQAQFQALVEAAADSLHQFFELPILDLASRVASDVERWQRYVDEQESFMAVDFERLLQEISSNALLEHARATVDATQRAIGAAEDLDQDPIVRAAGEIAAASAATVDGVPPSVAAGRALRDHLIATRTWWDSREVAQHLRGFVLESNPSEPASRLRREGRLFGVRHGGRTLHPPFQIDAQGELRPGLDRLIALLPKSSSNWTAAFWLFQPTTRLDGQCPADVFPSDPERVIAAAEKDFRGDHDEW